jgi:hypothetical protein
MLQLLLFLTVPENVISNDGMLRDLPPSEFKIIESVFKVIYHP